MKKLTTVIMAGLVLFILPNRILAWGKTGHDIVAEIAFHYLDDSTKKNVQHYLKKMSIEEAANWMDDMRTNSYYDYMRPWHYVNVGKDSSYIPSVKERDILIILNSVVAELRHKDSLKEKNVREDLYLLFHLMGDLHQPLHVGYGIDRGGNDIELSFINKGGHTNLHKVWDFEIIDTQKITLEDCLKQYDSFTKEEIAEYEKINVMNWMKQSRSLLDTVYNFKDGLVDQDYVDRNTTVIEKQLLIAGLRLASVLRESFKNK
jgi:hypothetical protein